MCVCLCVCTYVRSRAWGGVFFSLGDEGWFISGYVVIYAIFFLYLEEYALRLNIFRAIAVDNSNQLQ